MLSAVFRVAISILLPVSSLFGQDASTLSYLALGDSYTIGESVEINNRWPNQLAERLERIGFENEVTIVAKTGWRTDDLLTAIDNKDLKQSYNLVSLLIGVNNQYQSRDFTQYEAEFPLLLTKAIELANGDTSRVFVVSIPDYYFTPYGQRHRTSEVSKQLDEYNQFAERCAKAWGIPFFNITAISRGGLEDASLVAEDGLHPSSHQYALWVNEMIKSDFFEGLEW